MARYKAVIDAGGDPAEIGARVRQAKAQRVQAASIVARGAYRRSRPAPVGSSSGSPKSGSLAVIRLHTYSRARARGHVTACSEFLSR